MSYLKGVKKHKKPKIKPRPRISDDAQLKDHIFKQYCRRTDRFLDLFNYYVYDGEQVLTEDKVQLVDRDVTKIFVHSDQKGRLTSLGKLRDIFTSVVCKKDLISGTNILYLALEEQSAVDYTMPARAMLYDALTYSEQIKLAKSLQKKANINPKDKTAKISEGVSYQPFALPRTRHLTPVITLVVYLGKRSWTGPRSLHDMMPDIPEAIKSVIPNYTLNLIEAINLAPNQIGKFKTKWGAVFEAFQTYVKDGEKGLVNYVEHSNSLLEPGCNDDLQLIECMTGTLLPLPKEQRSKDMEMSQGMIDYLNEREQNAVKADRPKTERRVKLESAKSLLIEGIPNSIVSKCLGLSSDEVNLLKSELQAK